MTASSIDVTSCVRRHRDILVQSLDDDLVMADLESGHYYGFAHTAKRIWALLEEPVSVSTICLRLAEEYDVEAATCEREVIAFLDELQANKLLHVVA